MMQIEHAYRLTAVAAFVLPVAVAAGTRFLGSGPSNSLALVSEPPPALPGLGPAEAETKQPVPPVAQFPFWDDSRREYLPVAIPTDPEPTPVTTEPTQLRLTAVMPSTRTPLAVINGKPRRIGDRIDTVWTLIAIDGAARTVTVRSTSGQERTVTLSR